MREVDIEGETKELRNVLGGLGDDFYKDVREAAELLDETFKGGGKVLVCGNGGSAAEAQHFSDEMVGRYRENRPSYPVIALTADSPVVTCIGNDFGFEEIFARQVEGLGREGDILMALSTSGTSRNIIRAVDVAKAKGLKIIALTGPRGRLREMADISIEPSSENGARLQELHLHVIHLLSEYFESEEK